MSVIRFEYFLCGLFLIIQHLDWSNAILQTYRYSSTFFELAVRIITSRCFILRKVNIFGLSKSSALASVYISEFEMTMSFLELQMQYISGMNNELITTLFKAHAESELNTS